MLLSILICSLLFSVQIGWDRFFFVIVLLFVCLINIVRVWRFVACVFFLSGYFVIMSQIKYLFYCMNRLFSSFFFLFVRWLAIDAPDRREHKTKIYDQCQKWTNNAHIYFFVIRKMKSSMQKCHAQNTQIIIIHKMKRNSNRTRDERRAKCANPFKNVFVPLKWFGSSKLEFISALHKIVNYTKDTTNNRFAC